MVTKDIKFGSDAISALKKGMDIVHEAVAKTIGPKGTNVYIDDALTPGFTNDGVKIAHNIALDDRFENAGAWVHRNASAQTNDDAGDGTTSTVVLLQAIVEEVLKRPENRTQIMQSLMKEKKTIIDALKKRATKITKADLKKVALISSENEELATLIAEVVGKVGAKAVVTVEDRRDGFTTDYQLVQGYEAHVGYMSPYFRTDASKPRAVLENVSCITYGKKIATLGDLKPFELFAKEGINSLVVIATDVEPQMLGMFVATKMTGKMQLLVIRADGALIEDLAAAVGADLIGDDTGVTAENFTTDNLGHIKKIVCEEKKTIITSNAKSAIEQAKRLEQRAAIELNSLDKKKYLERAQKLRGGIAVIRIGSYTDAERVYLHDKAEDAVKATQAALDEGVVEGGGMALYRISEGMKPKTVGQEILKAALTSPLRWIIKNAGEDYAAVIKDLPKGEGYDAKNACYASMIESGIIDPVRVTRCAIENAVSTAAHFITTHAVIVEKKEDTN